MKQPLRYALAIVAGIVTAMLLVNIIEGIGHRAYPPPPGLDFADQEAMKVYIEALPMGALGYVLASWIIGTYGGGVVAGVIARTGSRLFPGIVGAVMLAAVIANLIMIPHPVWFALVGVFGTIVAAFMAGDTSLRFLGKPE
jgi:hypothetical protein